MGWAYPFFSSFFSFFDFEEDPTNRLLSTSSAYSYRTLFLPEIIPNSSGTLSALPFLIELLLVLAYWTGLRAPERRSFFLNCFVLGKNSSITGTGAATYAADTKLGFASRSKLVLPDLTSLLQY